MGSFVLRIKTRAAKTRCKRQASRLCLHDAARGKPTTSDEILGEEIGDDVLDAAHIDSVDDTGD